MLVVRVAGVVKNGEPLGEDAHALAVQTLRAAVENPGEPGQEDLLKLADQVLGDFHAGRGLWAKQPEPEAPAA